MLEDLFTESGGENSSRINTFDSKAKPLGKRKNTNFSGIVNQGATCYLNSLLQTLLLTKEFRENLFSLSDVELGLAPSKNGQQAKLRVIPVELQRLFSQLLFLDQEACSTSRLTDSFGWSNNEELQQHDVQELNRILFTAIEQSLVNTKQSKLIQNLYRGTCINKIKCLSCLNVFEREEEFLDLAVSVQGSPNLNNSLHNSFVIREKLEGNNKYRCEKCNNQYCDAEKYCQLKSLPPILTLSLLRFTYNLTTFQRIKETGRFEFPFEINLKEYMEDSIKSKISNDSTIYELFSVIIHSGSAYGGHYHCYIRDFDKIGKWTLADEITEELNKKSDTSEFDDRIPKEIVLICLDDDDQQRNDKDLVNLDYLKYEKPLDLLKAFVYNRYKYDEFRLENICADLTRETGVSWNKRFKAKYGPIEKFLRKNDDTFGVNQDGRSAKLKIHDEIRLVSGANFNFNETNECIKKEETKKKLKFSDEDIAELNTDYHWYDFDDARITPICTSKIKSQFEGKESAYMLFYRKKSLSKSSKNVLTILPNWLKTEIDNENNRLQNVREEYEKSLNSIKIECYLETDFYAEKNILYLKKKYQEKSFAIFCDKRFDIVENLKEHLTRYCTEQNDSDKIDQEIQERREKFLEILFDEVPFNWLLVERVQGLSEPNFYIKKILSDPSELMSNIFTNDHKNLLLIISKNLDKLPIGDEFMPISIWFKYYDPTFDIKQKSFQFTCNTIIKQVKQELGSYLLNIQSGYQLDLTDEELQDLSCQSFTFNLIKSRPSSIINPNENRTDTILLDQSNYDHRSLKELDVHNGDTITVESEEIINQLFEKKMDLSSLKDAHFSNRLIKVNVINFLLSEDELKSGNVPSCELFIEESDTVKNMRIMAISSFENGASLDQFHLRFLLDQDLDMVSMVQNFNIQDTQTKFFNALYDDSLVGEIVEPILKKAFSIDEPKLIFLLSPGKAPLQSNGDLVLKCCTDKCIGDLFVEILTNLNETVGQLTEKICSQLNLEPLDANDESVYYLRKLDWLGDVESVLNDLNQQCSETKLKNSQTIQLTKGVLIPPNNIKIKLWLCGKIEPLDKDEVVLNELIDNRQKDFRLIKEIIVSNEVKLDDLKLLVTSILSESQIEFIDFRLRILKSVAKEDWSDLSSKFIRKKALIEWHHSLKQLHLTQETDLEIELLDQDDSINQGVVLLDCVRFDLKTRLCSSKSFKQIFWNINNGATLASLKDSILKSYLDLEPGEAFRIHIAKRFYEKYQWIVLRDMAETQPQKGKKKKGSNAAQNTRSNLKQGPFHLGNGDLITFTVIDPTDNRTSLTPQDFMSSEDLDFMNKKNITEAEINRIRKDKQSKDQKGKKEVYRRPEVGIKIKIDDFSKD
ncbi:ubiquitin carboxyl-terminal hydrolase 40 [Brachionus plicatilis]|uniref:Ubiquitin carboxyl-terminal hydrolase 40 n=1 Tax=Brachionus plicatilis TaxID=10195 RepID=A0A3M7SW91_BRAPC|nr:ubiquitin carboxyl-terminal hydrolase 40 [Brachionus plicatilis]